MHEHLIFFDAFFIHSSFSLVQKNTPFVGHHFPRISGKIGPSYVDVKVGVLLF